jgi:hypothetical protein
VDVTPARSHSTGRRDNMEDNRILKLLMEFRASDASETDASAFKGLMEQARLDEEEIQYVENIMGVGLMAMKAGMITPRTVFTTIMKLGFDLGHEQGLLDA